MLCPAARPFPPHAPRTPGRYAVRSPSHTGAGIPSGWLTRAGFARSAGQADADLAETVEVVDVLS